MLWKLNSAWPTVIWQLYDWFLNPTSAYYFTKKALEPLHIQLNEDDYKVTIINTYHKGLEDLNADVKVYDFDLNVKWEKNMKFNIGEDSYKELFKVPDIKNIKGTYFVKLILTDTKGKVVSDNFYWFSSEKGFDQKVYQALKKARIDNKEYAKKVDHTDLASLKRVKLDLSYEFKEKNNEIIVTVKVKNNSKGLAFLNRLMVTRGEGGDEVLPTIWDDNFFTLFPGEEKILIAKFAKADLHGKKPVVAVDLN